MDYTYTSTRLTFNAATTSRTMTIPILEDDIVENCENITVTVTHYSSRVDISTRRATVNIIDNDGKQLCLSYFFLVNVRIFPTCI